jgi:hypothetical protein
LTKSFFRKYFQTYGSHEKITNNEKRNSATIARIWSTGIRRQQPDFAGFWHRHDSGGDVVAEIWRVPPDANNRILKFETFDVNDFRRKIFSGVRRW